MTSDNGPWFEGSPGGLRGRKGQSYEGGFRVPFIAWWPGRIPAGAVIDAPAMNIDLFPTFMALAGLSLPSDRVVDGADLWPLLSAGQAELPERPLFFFHDYDVEAVRLGRWKLRSQQPLRLAGAPRQAGHTRWPIAHESELHAPGGGASVPTLGTWPLLYQLQRDPAEAYNVAETRPEIAADLGQRLQAWRSEFLANPRGWRERKVAR